MVALTLGQTTELIRKFSLRILSVLQRKWYLNRKIFAQLFSMITVRNCTAAPTPLVLCYLTPTCDQYPGITLKLKMPQAGEYQAEVLCTKKTYSTQDH